MKIEKNARGWQIVPSTSEEQTALEFILKAFEETYSKRQETTTIDLTTHSLVQVPAHSMVETP
jgi:hypothetical protein